MKKYFLASIIMIVLISLLALNQEKVYGIVLENSQAEIIELSQEEKGFFDKMQLKQQYKDEGVMVVDTVNGVEKETITIDGVEYEKDALIYMIYKSSQNGDLGLAMKSYEEQMSISSRNHLYVILDKTNKGQLQYIDIKALIDDNDFIDEEKSLIKSLIPDTIILDSRDYNMMADYYYETLYYGYYQNYTIYNTICGMYYIQAEYYEDILGNPVYTGSTRYVLSSSFATYNHIETIEFNYQSYVFGVDGTTPPYATIYLINDYWGKEKMILESDDMGIEYKITQESHYARNQYNKIDGVSVDILYPTRDDLPSGWFYVPQHPGSYFHLLLSENSDNDNFTKGVTYQDINLEVTLAGGLEIVYDENDYVEYEDLVTFTFNFGVDQSDPDFEPLLPDAHYIRDVYPYLIWGNSENDYNNHTPFERFVWDKASRTNNSDARNAEREDLTDMYLFSQDIGDNGGTPIPQTVQNNACRWDIYFNSIPEQTIIKGQYSNVNWVNFITGEYSIVPGTISKFEFFDDVSYNIIGNYLVMVGIEDASGNKRTQVIIVHVSSC